MPIITKPSPLEKDATGIFSLDKTALALHPTVVASAHFSSPNVWEKIIVKYKSETLGQFESVEFDATLASPEGQFFVSATAEDIFEVEKITIIDKDGAILLIPRADLTVAEFDIDFGADLLPAFDGAANSAYISFPIPNSAIRLQPSVNVNNSGLSNFWMSSPITGNFTFTATVKAGLSSETTVQAVFGLNDSLPPTGFAAKTTHWGIHFVNSPRWAYVYGADVVGAADYEEWATGGTYNIEIKRTSGIVSYKIGNKTFPQTLTTSSTLYIVGCLQVGSWEVTNAQLVIS